MTSPRTPEELVFAGPHGGALRVTLFRRRFWLPAVKAAGLGGLRIHDLRHTAVALQLKTFTTYGQNCASPSETPGSRRPSGPGRGLVLCVRAAGPPSRPCCYSYGRHWQVSVPE
jgi:hypothetical protein